MAIKIRVPRFDPGALIFTPGALAIVPPDEVLDALVRHFAGDWSNLDIFDRQQNERALANDGRLLSSFQSRQGYVLGHHGSRPHGDDDSLALGVLGPVVDRFFHGTGPPPVSVA